MSGPLTGLKIVEMVGIGPGPFAAMMMADLGAEVIRIHPINARSDIPTMNTPADVLARNRKSVAIDIKSSAGKDTLLRLIAKADGMIEGFRPGVMERLGLGPDICLERNPKLAFGRITGWGQDGPQAQSAGHDINYISVTGLLNAMGVPGQAPNVPLNLIGDFGGGGMYMAFGLVSAMLNAARTGRGQVVDAAMIDGAALLTAMIWGFRAGGVWSDERQDNFLDGGAWYYGTYVCADGKYLAIGPIEGKFRKIFAEAAGLDDDIFADEDRKLWPVQRARVAGTLARKTRDEWVALFDSSDGCVSPVLDWNEAQSHPQIIARQTLIDVAGVVQPAPGPRFSETPATMPTPPEKPGANSTEILADWGFEQQEINALIDNGVVQNTQCLRATL